MQVWIAAGGIFEGVNYPAGMQSVDDRIALRMIAGSFAAYVRDLYGTVKDGKVNKLVPDVGTDFEQSPGGEVNLDARTDIAGSDFTDLWNKYGNLEDIARYLNAINFSGTVTLPVGSWRFAKGASIRGLKAPNIHFKSTGAPQTSATILTNMSEIYNSEISIGLVTMQDFANSGCWNSKINCMAGASNNACTFLSRPVLNLSNLWADRSAFEQGLTATYMSNVHVDGATFKISDDLSGVPNGIYAEMNSYVSWQGTTGRITNPGNLPDAAAVFAATGATILANGSAKIGQSSTPAIAFGVFVGLGGRVIGPPTFQGTVTTQYSQPVDVVTASGVIHVNA